MAKIQFQTGARNGEEVALSDSGVTIGRGESASLVVDDSLISGEHLTIKRVDGSWWAFDLDSSNGTRINGKDIKSIALSGDEKIELGDTRILFQINTATAPATATTTAPKVTPRSSAASAPLSALCGTRTPC